MIFPCSLQVVKTSFYKQDLTHSSQSPAAGTVEDLATLYVMRGGEEIPEIRRSSLSWRTETSSTSPMSAMSHRRISTRPFYIVKNFSVHVDNSFSPEGNNQILRKLSDFLYQLSALSSLEIEFFFEQGHSLWEPLMAISPARDVMRKLKNLYLRSASSKVTLPSLSSSTNLEKFTWKTSGQVFLKDILLFLKDILPNSLSYLEISPSGVQDPGPLIHMDVDSCHSLAELTSLYQLDIEFTETVSEGPPTQPTVLEELQGVKQPFYAGHLIVRRNCSL